MDYVDFVVHIFLTEKRTYYDIERLRKSARTIDLEQLKAMLVEKTVVARSKPAKKAATVKKTAKKPVAKKTVVKKARCRPQVRREKSGQTLRIVNGAKRKTASPLAVSRQGGEGRTDDSPWSKAEPTCALR